MRNRQHRKLLFGHSRAVIRPIGVGARQSVLLEAYEGLILSAAELSARTRLRAVLLAAGRGHLKRWRSLGEQVQHAFVDVLVSSQDFTFV
jgi:hypothetical protein